MSFLRRILTVGEVLLFPFLLTGQSYIPLQTLTGEGEGVSLAYAAGDTSGNLFFAGVFQKSLSFGEREITDSAVRSLFAGRTDSSGHILSLTVAASCDGLCDLQAYVVRPGGSSCLFVSCRGDLHAGDTVYGSRGVPQLVMITLDAAGQVTGSRRLMKKFQGRVKSALADTAGGYYLGGWFRKCDSGKSRMKARDKRDAFVMYTDSRGATDFYVLGGAGEQEVDLLLPGDSALLIGGTFSQEITAGRESLRCEEGVSLFMARLDSSGIGAVETLARGGELLLCDGVLTDDHRLILGGAFAGRMRTGDTAVTAAGYHDGYLLFAGEEKRQLLVLAGSGDGRVQELVTDRRGRIFVAGTYRGTLVTGEDTLDNGDRSCGTFLAETDGRATILWALRPGGDSDRTLVTLAATADLLLWTGGTWHRRPAELTGGRKCSDGIYLSSWLDPCTLMHFDLPDDHFLCEGHTDTLDAGEGYVSWRWEPGDYTGRRLPVSDTGVYHVTVTDQYGCIATDSIYVRADSVRLRFDTREEILPGGYNGSVDLTVTSGLPPYTFLWNTGDVTEDLSGLQGGVYSVTVTDSAGCVAAGETEVTVRDVTAVYDLYNYPNPFRELTRILYSLPEKTPVEISIWDVSGKKLFVLAEKNGRKGAQSFVWARKNLKDGVYYLKMRSRFGEITKKIMIISR